MKYKIGVVGLGVMGHSLALNMERNGIPLAGYDLDPARTKALLDVSSNGGLIAGADSPAKMFALLEKPRRILMLVPAGAPVDSAIEQFEPYLESGDLLIDGGNSFFMDTERRNKALEKKGFNFIGMGISGGEKGALWGPSIMPGGQREAWDDISNIFCAISAKACDGQPCVEYIGPRGAGHYVKMIHNGIEYSDMQLIAEVYDILHRGLGMPAPEMADLFDEWNRGELKSYLIEITADILRHIDPETGLPLVDLILDEAQQKGTGKWTSQNALDIGAPIPAINAAVESRILSSLKSQRVAASRIISGPPLQFKGNQLEFIKSAQAALYAAKIAAYSQGFGMLQIASEEYKYDLKLCEIARIWRGGCIIRTSLLEDINAVFNRNPKLINMLFDDVFRSAITSRVADWRRVVQTAIGLGIPTMGLSASLAFFDAFRSERLPANLTQAQRDYFGAHTYRRIDKDGVFHTEWQ